MWHLRQAVLDVLDPVGSADLRRLAGVGSPEDGLVHPVGLLQHPLAEPERLEHLHRPARHTVGLTDRQRTELLVDDPCGDIGKGRKLRGQRQACGPAPDDQYVDFTGRSRSSGLVHTSGGTRDRGIAGRETVEVVLHGSSFPPVGGQAVRRRVLDSEHRRSQRGRPIRSSSVARAIRRMGLRPKRSAVRTTTSREQDASGQRGAAELSHRTLCAVRDLPSPSVLGGDSGSKVPISYVSHPANVRVTMSDPYPATGAILRKARSRRSTRVANRCCRYQVSADLI